MSRRLLAAILLASAAFAGYPSVASAAQTGAIAAWPESGEIFRFDEHVAIGSQIEAWWSINTLSPPRDWFYALNPSTQVAHVPGVTHVAEINDASVFTYEDRVVGPVDEGDFVLFHNTVTGYYAAFRVDDIYGTTPGESRDSFVDITWYFQDDGTADFSSFRTPNQTPIPIPALTELGLIALAGLAFAVLLWRRRSAYSQRAR